VLECLCSEEHREAASKMFWQLLNIPDAETAAKGKRVATGSPEGSVRPKAPKWPNIQSARVAVKLFQTLGMTVDEIGGLSRVRTDFVAPLLRLSERNGQVCST
jgi:hypothetical protein